MRITRLARGLTDEQVQQLATDIKHSLLARVLRQFLQEEIERSYKAEEQVSETNDTLPFYLKEVGERRGYRQVLHLILEE